MNTFSAKANKKVNDFFAMQKIQQLTKGEYLIQAGTKPDYIYYLLEGQVRQFDTTLQGDEVVVNIFKPGTYFPMSYAFNQNENQFDHQAYSNIRVSCADIKETLLFVTSDIDVMSDLLSRVYLGTNGLQKRMIQLMVGSGKSRFLQELVIQGQRFGTLNQDGSTNIPITLTELASRAGLTRETASRVTSELRKLGLASVTQPGIVIKDLSKIEEMIE